MQSGPDDVVIVTADMSVSNALRFCLLISPLIVTVQYDVLQQHLDFEREASLPCVLHSIARYSGKVGACVCQYRDLDSEILRREIRSLAISVVRRRSVVAQSF
jgi:hypothetical protein